jgi:hypothetical protein
MLMDDHKTPRGWRDTARAFVSNILSVGGSCLVTVVVIMPVVAFALVMTIAALVAGLVEALAMALGIMKAPAANPAAFNDHARQLMAGRETD